MHSGKRIFPVLLFFLVMLAIFQVARAMELLSLDNGLTLILDERPGSGVCAVQFWVKVGSKYESMENAGITHFIEHLIFKGSERLKTNEIASRIEALGGSINAFTSYDNTVYHVVIPGDSCEEGFFLLGEAVLNPVFPEEEIEKEKNVVLEEIKMGEDDPEKKLYKELFSLSYPDHPYGKPIIGFPETVGRLSRKEILSYFEEHYVPEGMIVVVSGDIEKSEMEKLGRKLFEKLPKRKRSIFQKKKVTTGGRMRIIEKDVLESHVAIAYPIPNITHEDIPVLEVISNILTEGESSRLQSELKNRRKVVTQASSFTFTPEEEGLFVVHVNFRGREFSNVVREVEKEIRKLVDDISEWELKKARNQIKASYIYAMETVEGRARMLGYYYSLTGDPSFVDRFLEKVDRVRQEDIKRAIEKYFGEERKNVVVLLPKKEKKKNEPAYGELANGLRYVINENKSAPLFAFSIGFIGGLKDEPYGKNGIFNVLSRMLLRGTKKKNAKELAISIDSLAGQINPFSGYNLFGLTGKFMSKDFKEAMGLLKEILTDTRFTDEELANVKNEVLSELRLKEDNPVSYVFRKFNSFVYEGHPYEKDPSGSMEDVPRITLDDLRRFYSEYVSPKNCVFAVSGDVTVEDTKNMIEELFSNWEGQRKELKREKITQKRGEAFYEKNMLQNHIVFGFPGVSLVEDERFAIEIIDAILSGMGGRIHRALRENNPFAYATTFFNQIGYDTGVMGIYAAFDPRFLEEVKKTVQEEIEAVLRDGFTEDEVERAKKYLVGNYRISMQSNSSIAYRIMVDTFYGLGPEFHTIWPQMIRKVKTEEVNRVAKKFLRLESLATVIVGRSTKSSSQIVF